MASVVLGTIGSAVGGSAGRTLGTLTDHAIDGTTHKGSIRDLNLQSSAYGDTIPLIFGRVRTGGVLIWALPLQERSLGAKGTTTRHAYSASFAIALAARPIAGIGQVWADGKLMGSAGAMPRGTTMRVYTGGERQTPDPLIAAAESPGQAPAHRGIAYVVFEDLDLSPYANRMPALSFEVIADAASPDAGQVAVTLAAVADIALDPGPATAAVAGLLAKGTVATSLSVAARVAGVTPALTAGAAAFAPGATPVAVIAGDAGNSWRESTAATVPDAIALEYWDPDRDYQLGTQRVSGTAGPTARATKLALPITMAATNARALAARTLADIHVAARTATVTLGAQGLAIRPGSCVQIAGQIWRVRRAAFAGVAVTLTLERLGTLGAVSLTADSGRVLSAAAAVPGDTVVQLLDLPPLSDAQPAGIRLWAAAAGTGTGWRGADIYLTTPVAAAPALAGQLSAAAVMGTISLPPSPGVLDAWDDVSTVEVALLDRGVTLQSRADADVLAGANVALAGDEIIQFGLAELLAPGRFRLRHLLRARRGTDAGVVTHTAGERFVVLDPAALLALDLGADARGGSVTASALATAEVPGSANTITAVVDGRSVQSLPPVHLTAGLHGGDLVIGWIDRASTMAWSDAADPLPAPMIVEVRGAAVHQLPVAAGGAVYTAAAMRADGFDPTQAYTVAVSPALANPPSWTLLEQPQTGN